ncbi:NADPH:quinone reductase [Modestobacter altitudinis]|uniref:NADPH:quinone reductase n=1 Tax=Modestobacter altitudinis TaxID=2213158 RepID=UPI001C554E59|nr:NADPH:quinone reductase [Modestobacter altitudinis]
MGTRPGVAGSPTGVPARMRAAWIEELGSADSIRYGELPVPAPGPTDVLVRVTAIAVDPVDILVRSGRYRTPLTFPFVVGRDLVGAVVAVGSPTVPFELGEMVWCNSLGHGGRQGAAAEYAVVPADRLYRLPAGVDPVDAVAVLHPGATAHLALATHAGLRAGETVYVAGGAGHVGGAAVMLAARAGARVVASADEADLEHCRSAGATVALDYRDPLLVRHIAEAAPSGVDVHLDTSGHADLATAVDLLAPRGRIIAMAGFSARPELPMGRLYGRDGRLLGFAISNASTSELAAAALRVNQCLADGSLAPRGVDVLPLSATAEAHRRLEGGRARGVRLVLQPQP